MTPEEKAIIEWAKRWRRKAFIVADEAEPWELELSTLVEALPDLPPIGPENDLGVYGIDEGIRCRCPREDCEHSTPAADDSAPEWVPATFLMCLAGDRIRMSGQETDVRRSSSGVWHANNANAWHPEKWTHTELRMDLAANPGFIQYPPNTPCEILMSPERKAAHLLMQTFPGSQIVS